METRSVSEVVPRYYNDRLLVFLWELQALVVFKLLVYICVSPILKRYVETHFALTMDVISHSENVIIVS